MGYRPNENNQWKDIMKNEIKAKIPKIVGVLFAAMFASSVNATIVNLDFESGFIKTDVDAKSGLGGSLGNTVDGNDVYEMMNWITNVAAANDSTLLVENFAGLSLDSMVGGNVTLQTFTQVNNVQGATFSWDIDLINELFIGGVSQGSNIVEINFKETFNSSGPCANLSPSGNFCDDIYELQDPENMIEIASDPGLWLHVYLEAGSGVTCNTVGTDVTCYTPEISPGTSMVHVKAELVRVAVPEPSLLALFGLGLFGLGASRLRKS